TPSVNASIADVTATNAGPTRRETVRRRRRSRRHCGAASVKDDGSPDGPRRTIRGGHHRPGSGQQDAGAGGPAGLEVAVRLRRVLQGVAPIEPDGHLAVEHDV